jgi:hypothetical protein
MSNYKRKEVFDYLTRKPVTTQDIELAKTRIQTPVTPAPMQVTSGEDLGTREGFREGTTLSINPMLDNLNPNTIGGAAVIPTAGITAAMIADKMNVSLEDAGRMLKRLYTGPEGLVIGGDRLTEEAKPDIEKFPSGEKPETSLITKIPNQTKTDTGLTPPKIDIKIPGLKPDTGEDTSILYATKFGPDVIEKFKKMRETSTEQEILDTLGISKSYQTMLAKKIGLPSKTGTQSKSKVFSEAIGGLEKEITPLIDNTKTPNENFEIIFPQVKNKEFLIGTNEFGNVSEQSVKRKINERLMELNSLSVEDYKNEMRKMAADRTYVPNENFFDPLKILKPAFERTPTDVKTYKIPNRDEAREQIKKEIPNFNELYDSNVRYRKKQTMYEKEKYDEDRRLLRIETKKQRDSSYRERLGGTSLSERERLINLVQGTTQKQTNNEIKQNPELLISFLNNNPEKLKLLGSRVNKKTGEIYFEKPNLSFLNKNQDDTVRFFEIDHARSAKGKGPLLDVPENRNLIPRTLNNNFKKDAEAFIESLDFTKRLTNSETVALQNVLEHAKKVKVRLRPDIEKGILKTNDFYQPISNPLTKINDHIEFWAPDFKPKQTILPRDNKGRPITDFFRKDYGKKEGGRVKFQNGSDDGYMQEIPSLGFSDPIDILEQQMINEKDPTRILALDFKLTQMKKRQAEKQKAAEEEKIAQKEKGVRYKEDFPSEADYFIETGKQLVTNPKYFYGKLGKGVVEGTEFLVGQPLQTLFSQTGKNFEFYEPVLGEKLGINKFIKENQPEFPTTGTLLAGDVAEIAGSVLDPFLAYGIVKGAAKASKTKTPVVIEETVDPTRRDLLKMGAVLTGGAIAYPTAKKLGLLETGVKVAKTGNAVRIATHGVVDNMPEFFPYLSEFSLARGKSTGDYMRSGMTEFKRELNLPLEIGGTKKNVKFEFVHDPAEGNVTAYYTNPLTDEKHAFDYYTGKQGKQAYGIDPEFPNAYEYYAVEVEPPGFYYKSPDKADPYRKNFEYYDTATEGDEVIQALDKWYKGLSKEEKAKFEKKFITHSEYTDELPAASNKDENYPIMDYMYPKKKND